MNVRLLLLPVMLVGLLTGCRRDPRLQVYIDNMNAEKRMLEDTLYDLQHDYDSRVSEIEKLRKELASLKSGGVSSATPPEKGQPRNLFPDIPELKPPTIEEGVPSDGGAAPPAKSPQQAPSKEEGPDDLEPPKLDLGGAGDSLSAIPMPSDTHVTELHLDPARTGGLQQDDQPGDDGIQLVFQPRNSQHDFVPQPGRVSVVLLDEESRKRVARWEFTRDDTALALQHARAGEGIELTMPWQESPPTKSNLHLFVRVLAARRPRRATGPSHHHYSFRPTDRPLDSTITTVGRQCPESRGCCRKARGGGHRQQPWHRQFQRRLGSLSWCRRQRTTCAQARLPQWRPYR